MQWKPQSRKSVIPCIGREGEAVIALSPHSDDLAFSLGAAFWDGRLAGCHPVTIFSRSRYTLSAPDGDLPQVTMQRKAEDRRFFSRTAAKAPVWLDQPDAPVRRNIRPEQVFSAAADPDESAELARLLDAHLPRGRTLLAPLALGGHLDHRLVRGAAWDLKRRRNCKICFYEDLPYAALMELPAIQATVEALQLQLGVEFIPILWSSLLLEQAKAWAVESYPSQSDNDTLRCLLHHARRIAWAGVLSERVWSPL